MIKNIVFDMGNVLIHYTPEDCLHGFTQNGEDRALLMREVFHSVEWVLCDRGAITDAQAVERICKRVPQRLHSVVNDLYAHWYEEMQPNPQTNQLAQQLKSAGYRMYLLSNAAQSFYQYYRAAPAMLLLDGLFISSDWGLIKPELEIYRAFHAHFGLVPSQCFFIDDFPLNIEASIRSGMPGYIFDGDMGALKTALRAAGVQWAGSDEE